MGTAGRRCCIPMFAFVVRRIMLHHLRQRKLLVDNVSYTSYPSQEWKLSLRSAVLPLELSLTILGPLPRYESGPPSSHLYRFAEAVLRESFRRGTQHTVSEIQMRFLPS